jgi:hypothetical protein
LSLAFIIQVSETPDRRKEREAQEKLWSDTLVRCQGSVKTSQVGSIQNQPL